MRLFRNSKRMPTRLGQGCAILLVLLTPGTLRANPSGGQVVSGQASFSIQGNTLNITTSDQVSINWQDFSIGVGETTQFFQPSSSSLAVNRVVTGNPSGLYGTLRANGHIMLINPNGIVVGAGGVIDTGGFVGSTLDLPDNQIFNGDWEFSGGRDNVSIENFGTIHANGGDVILISREINNAGTITAPNGKVALAAGKEVLLARKDDATVGIYVRPEAGSGSIHNSGTIQAMEVEMEAAGGNPYAFAIQNSGTVRAVGFDKSGGRVRLLGHEGLIKLAGEINAGFQEKAGDAAEIVKGGVVEVTAPIIHVLEATTVEAKGLLGGGRILIGGDVRGEGPLANAQNVVIEQNATFNADAIQNGDGGEIVVFAEDSVEIYGSFSARGGAEGGDGGFIETSGKVTWYFPDWVKSVDVSSLHGKGGEFLIDPTNFTVIGSGVAGANEVLDDDISTALGGGADFTVATSLVGLDDGDITINDDVIITWTTGNKLTFDAHDDVIFGDSSISGVNGTLVVEAEGAVFQGGASSIAVNGLKFTGAANFNLTTGTNTVTNFASNATGSFNLSTAGALNIGTVDSTVGITGASAVTLSTGGNITQDVGTSVGATGVTTLNAGANDITLGSGTNEFVGAVNVTGANVSLNDDTDLTLGTTSLTGNLTLEADGAITVPNALSVNGGAGSLTIANSGGTNFQGTVGAGAIVITDTTGTVDFDDVVTATSITGADGAGDYTVNFDAAPNVSGAGAFNDGAGAVVFDSGGSFGGGLTVAGTTTLAGTITTTGTAINLGAVTLAGASELDTGNAAAGTISVGAVTGNGNALTLDSGATAGATIMVASMVDGSGGLTIRDSGGAVMIGDVGSIAAGDLTVTDSQGAVTFTANVDATVLTVTNSNGVTFNSSVDATTITLTDTTGTINFEGSVTTGALNTAGGTFNVSMTGASNSVTADTNFMHDGTLTLGNAATDMFTFSGGLDTTAVTGTVSIAGTVATNDMQIDLGAITLSAGVVIDTGANGANINIGRITGSTNTLGLDAGTTGTITATHANNVMGDLVVTAANASISELADITQGAAVTDAWSVTGTTTLNSSAAQFITLDNSANNFGGAVNLSAFQATLHDANDLSIGTVSLTNLILNAGGAISVPGALSVTNLLRIHNSMGATFTDTVSAATIDILNTTGTLEFQDNISASTAFTTANQSFNVSILGSSNSFGSGSFQHTGTLTLGDASTDTTSFTSNLSRTSHLTVVAGNLRLALASTLGSVILAADTAIDIVTGSMTVNGAVTDGVNNFTLNLQDVGGTGNFIFGGDVTINRLTTNNGVYSVAFQEDVTIDTDTTFSNIGGLFFGAGGGDILTFSGGVDTTSSTLDLSGSLVTANQQIDIGVMNVNSASVIDSGATGANINLGQVSGGTNALTLDAGTSGTVTATHASNVFGNLTVTAASASITENSTLTQGATAGDAWNVTGATVLNTSGSAIVLTNASNQLGDLTVNASQVSITENDAITQGGAWTVTNLVTLNAGTNAITLTNMGNDFGGAVSVTGSDVSLRDINALALGTTVSTSNLTLQAGGAISVPTLLNVGGGAGTLTIVDSGGASFTNSVTAGTVVLTDTTGTISFSAGLTVNTGLVTTNQAYNVSITGSSNSIAGDTNFLNTGTVTIGGAGTTSTFTGGLATAGNASNPSSTTIAGTVQTSNARIDLGATTLAADTTINSGTADTVFASTVNAGAAILQITADEIDFNGGSNSVTGTANLLLRPSADTTSIGIAGGVGTLDLSATDLAALNGFSAIFIGRGSSTAAVDLDSFTAPAPVTILGGGSLTGPDAGNTYNITGSNTGTISGFGAATLTFQNIGVLTGGSGNDSFIFANAGNLSGSLDGGGGTNDTLTGDSNGNAFGISAPDMGTLTGKTTGWSNIENLNGGAGADSFAFSGTGALSGNLAAGLGSDTLDLSALSSGVTVTLASDASVTGLASLVAGGTGITGIENFSGTSAGDTITVNPISTATTDNTRLIDGNNPTGGTGDTLTYMSGGGTVTFGSATISETGFGDVSYQEIETLSFNGAGGFTLSGAAGDETLTLTTVNTTDINFAFTAGASGSLTGFGASALTWNAAGGDDTLIVDGSSGNALIAGGIVYNGQTNTSTNPGDGLKVIGDSTNDIATYTPSATTAGSGVFTFNGVDITFTGLEPVDAAGFTTITVSPAGAADALTVTNGSAFYTADAALRISGSTGGTAIETIALFNNTNVVINTTTVDGNDTVTIASADNGHGNTNFTVTTDGGATTDTININGNMTFTGGNVNLNDSVVLGGASTVTAGTVDFNDTLNGGNTLVITGNAFFDDLVGTGTALASLSVSGTTTLDTGAVTTTGNQTYTGAVTLNNGISLNSGGTVAFASTVDSSTGTNQSLAINGNATFGGAVGATDRLSTLNVSGTSRINTADINTTGNQTYTGVATVDQDTTLTGATITFGNTLNSATAETNAVSITGNGTFNNTLGVTDRLSTLTVSGITRIIGGGDINTSSNQTYSGAFIMGVDTDLDANGNLVTFGGTVGSSGTTNRSLTISNNSNTAFDGVLGNALLGFGVNNLTVAGTTNINTTAIRTSGTQTYTGAVMVDAGTTLTGTTVAFANTLDSKTGESNAVAINGNATFANTVGATDRLSTLSVSGTSGINTNDINTSSTQTYTGAVTLGSDVDLDASGNLVTFGNTINGGQTLTISNASNAQFDGAVGAATRLTGLSVAGTSLVNTNDINTNGTQTFTGAVTLGSDVDVDANGNLVTFGSTLNGAQSVAISNGSNASFNGIVGGGTNLTSLSVAGTTLVNTTGITTTGNQSYTGAVTIDMDTTITGGTIAFGNTINSAGGETNSLAVVGNASFANTIGATDRLSTLSVSGSSAINTNDINTTGTQTFTGAVTLGSNLDLDANGNLITFGDTVQSDGTHRSLSISNNSNTDFNGVVGGGGAGTELSALSVAGSTAIDTTAITTTGTQTYTGAATLGVNTNLTGTTVTFGNTLNGSRSLTVTGNGVFNGVVGGATNLTAVTVTGTAHISAAGITTTGDQSYTGNITLGADTVLTGATPTYGNIIGAGNDLTLNFSGLTLVNGANITGVDALTTGNGGTTQITGNVTTTGFQTYNDVVILTGNTVLDANGNLVTFASTVQSDGTNRSLAISNSSNAAFNGIVGGGGAGSELTSLSVAGTTALNATGVTTVGNQTYTGAVTLGSNTTLDGGAGNLVTFGATLQTDGTNRSLNVSNSNGRFDGDVGGGGNVLTSLNVDGSSAINGSAITTAGAITLNTITQGAGVTYTSTSGPITITGLDGGGNAATVNSGTGNTTLSGTVNNLTTLSLTGNNLFQTSGTWNATTIDLTATGDAGTLANPLGVNSTNLVMNIQGNLFGTGSLGNLSGTVQTGNLSLTVNTNITQGAGVGDAISVGGDFNLNVGTRTVTLTNANNQFGGIGVTAATAQVTEMGDTNILTSNVAGQFDVVSTGEVTQTGGITAGQFSVNNSGSGMGISLAGSNAVGTLLDSNSAGGFTFNANGPLTVNNITASGLTQILSAGNYTMSGTVNSGAGSIKVGSTGGEFTHTAGTLNSGQIGNNGGVVIYSGTTAGTTTGGLTINYTQLNSPFPTAGLSNGIGVLYRELPTTPGGGGADIIVEFKVPDLDVVNLADPVIPTFALTSIDVDIDDFLEDFLASDLGEIEIGVISLGDGDFQVSEELLAKLKEELSTEAKQDLLDAMRSLLQGGIDIREADLPEGLIYLENSRGESVVIETALLFEYLAGLLSEEEKKGLLDAANTL